MSQREVKRDISDYLMDYCNCRANINTMMGHRQQWPKIGLTVCPDLVDHYTYTRKYPINQNPICDSISV